MSDLLNQVYLDSLGHAFALGDNALIPHGSFTETGPQNLVFSAVNSNNHQLTWGVLSLTIETLASFMNGAGFGRARFTIFDGNIEVGTGSIEG